MRFEIPKFTRCCGCFPLRHGIIVIGYLSLAFAIFVIWLDLHLDPIHHIVTARTVAIYRGAQFFTEQWLPVLLYCIEIVFITVLLIGAHTKRRRLLRVYYYYGIMTSAAALATYLLVCLKMEKFHWSLYLVDWCTMFSGIVTQVYLLLLIRSLLEKPSEILCDFNHLREVSVQPARDGLNLVVDVNEEAPRSG